MPNYGASFRKDTEEGRIDKSLYLFVSDTLACHTWFHHWGHPPSASNSTEKTPGVTESIPTETGEKETTPTEPGATETLSDMDEEEDSQERPPIMPSPKEEMKMEQEKEEEDKDKKKIQ